MRVQIPPLAPLLRSLKVNQRELRSASILHSIFTDAVTFLPAGRQAIGWV